MGLRKKVKVFGSSLRYSRRNISLNEEGEPNLRKEKRKERWNEEGDINIILATPDHTSRQEDHAGRKPDHGVIQS
jgi:hypothetical protein